MTLSVEELAFDSKHIWHPYSNLSNPTPTFGVESAEGVYLNLSNGQKVIDGMASWWSAIHGYSHPALTKAIQQQAKELSHIMFGGLTHQPAIDLCKKLIKLSSENLDCVFLADSGSVAVEVALKMASQYWYSNGKKSKTKFLTFKGGYHGDTFGAMSVCDPNNGMHSMFADMLPKHLFVDIPTCKNDKDWKNEHIEAFAAIISEEAENIAAVIVEPLVQGAGGMRFYCPEYLRQIRCLCDEYNVLLILDEIATGFGRTGTLFAYEQAEIRADILCLGKALTGGMLTLGATLCSREIANTISSYQNGNFMHGPTFMGNPLACAAANAGLGILENGEWKSQVEQIELQLRKELRACSELESVADVRVKGAIGVIELKRPINIHDVQPKLVERGVWIRPFGRLLYVMPPYIISTQELNKLTSAMIAIAEYLCNH